MRSSSSEQDRLIKIFHERSKHQNNLTLTLVETHISEKTNRRKLKIEFEMAIALVD